MSEPTGIRTQYTWQTTGGETRSHVCHCVGCCPRCGTCSTWPGHTPEYCDLLVRQRVEREQLVRRTPAGGV